MDTIFAEGGSTHETFQPCGKIVLAFAKAPHMGTAWYTLSDDFQVLDVFLGEREGLVLKVSESVWLVGGRGLATGRHCMPPQRDGGG
jgi:hypothetical protein